MTKNENRVKAPRQSMGIAASRRLSNGIVYALLIIMTVVWLFPFFGILMESFKVGKGSGGMDGRLFPKEWGLDNYVRLFTETNFLIWFRNTAFMGICTAVFQTLFVLMMSYTLSRLRFKGRKLLMNAMLILGMFPGFLTLVLIYKVFSDWGLYMDRAPIGLIIVYCASSGMGYYISKGFFDTIPKSLDEAARVDGATRLQVFYKVIMPLSGSIVIYTLLMGFMAPWGDFMMAKYIAHARSEGFNVAVGMWSWLDKTAINANYTMFCAAGVVVAVPVTIVFLLLQKYYVEGVTGGAVKG
jgi:arabinogalactan oligomer/maltooligosaccharide transport system permease protein